MANRIGQYDQSITSNGYDVIRTHRGVLKKVASNLPKKEAEDLMKNLRRRAIDNCTDVYFRVVPHTR